MNGPLKYLSDTRIYLTLKIDLLTTSVNAKYYLSWVCMDPALLRILHAQKENYSLYLPRFGANATSWTGSVIAFNVSTLCHFLTKSNRNWQSQTYTQLFEITKNDNVIFTCYISGKLSCTDRDTAFVRFFGGALLLGWDAWGVWHSQLMLENHIIWAKIGWIQVLK